MLTVDHNIQNVLLADGSEIENDYVIVNGITDTNPNFSDCETGGLILENSLVIEILLNHSFKDVGIHFIDFGFDKVVDWWENPIRVTIFCNEGLSQKFPCIHMTLGVEWETWDKSWSMSSFIDALKANINALNNERIRFCEEYFDDFPRGFGIEYIPENLEIQIKPEFEIVITTLKMLLEETTKKLIETVDRNVVFAYFQFPEDVKTSCKQYLIYFTQFLADIGIAADTEIMEEANQTLFKIIPKDKKEGLGKIREALDIYLNAPNSKEFQIQIEKYPDEAIKQWQSNIYHLKSQLLLANSIQLANQATIEAFQLSNFQYRQLLEQKENTKEQGKEEDIIKGVIKVGQFRWNGVTIELGEILKKIKRRFRKK
jgi:hypothetical protein